ncbi:hypothetical protein AAG570_007949 [Ranatra chinensis]|uniref:Uncharacterized protein n=1 Tax=Ranatra chinensis TaxID=642074 RepID=A0ABD0Y6M3_9HEMI
MFKVWFIAAYLAIFNAAENALVCEICECSKSEVDCTSRGLENHFNDSQWTSAAITAEHVNFENNYIVHLKPFPLLGLTHLSLRNNHITSIDDITFKNLKNLTYLDLSYNHLLSENLKPHIFKGDYSTFGYEPLTLLKTLKLSSNSLHTLRPDIFEHLPNLKFLYLDGNPFRMIDQRTLLAISSILRLQELDLSSTMVSSLPATMFHSARYLKVLNISDNEFSKPPSALGELVSLEVLVMDNNPIQIISEFPRIPTLKVLKIRSMALLHQIKDQSLSYLENLEELHCSNNLKLDEISSFALAKTEGEEKVWPRIKKLYLNNNNIKYLESEFLSNWQIIEDVDLQHNPWSCDCENQWIVSNLIPIIQSKQLNKSALLICQHPTEMLGRSMADLSSKKYEMRCLDAYGNRPENDASVLIGVLIGVLLAIPLTLMCIILYRRSMSKTVHYSRAFYSHTGGGSMESFS